MAVMCCLTCLLTSRKYSIMPLLSLITLVDLLSYASTSSPACHGDGPLHIRGHSNVQNTWLKSLNDLCMIRGMITTYISNPCLPFNKLLVWV